MDWFAAGITACVLALACLPKLWSAGGGLKLERVFEAGSGPGELLVRLRFSGRRVPPFLIVQVREQLENESAADKRPLVLTCWKLPWLSGEWSVLYTLDGLGRGRYRFTPATVSVTDPFGLVCGLLRAGSADVFTVLPQPEGRFEAFTTGTKEQPLPHTRGVVGEEGGKPDIRAGAGLLSRPYRSGDPLRRIDWRQAAKGRGLQTRQDERASSPAVVLVLDLEEKHFLDGQSKPRKGADGALDACAGAAAQSLREAAEGRCSMQLYGGEAAGALVPAGNLRAVHSAAMLLAAARPAAGAGAIAVLERLIQGHNLRPGSRIVVTTFGMELKDWERLVELVRSARCRLELRVPLWTLPQSAAFCRERQLWASKNGVLLSWIPLAAERRLAWSKRTSVGEEESHDWQAWS